MSIKIEERGKYGGVKVHLDSKECELFLKFGIEEEDCAAPIEGCCIHTDASIHQDEPHVAELEAFGSIVRSIGRGIADKLKENPALLTARTPEQVAAILAKEVEKATLQLDRIKRGKDFSKVNSEKLREALLKHVPSDK